MANRVIPQRQEAGGRAEEHGYLAFFSSIIFWFLSLVT
jgi:hypothetical protein